VSISVPGQRRDAIAGADAARPERVGEATRAALADAERQLATLSAEARQLKGAREVTAWIGAARGSSAT
jgi:hypothetical protein